MTLPNTKDYLNSIISNLGVIEAFSYIDEARTRETLEKVDTVLDTLRDYLEGREHYAKRKPLPEHN